VGLELELMYYNAKKDISKKIGHWSSSSSTQTRLSLFNGSDADMNELENADKEKSERVTLTVVTKEEKPYVYLRPGKQGNDAFDGFAIDLLKVSDIKRVVLKL